MWSTGMFDVFYQRCFTHPHNTNKLLTICISWSKAALMCSIQLFGRYWLNGSNGRGNPSWVICGHFYGLLHVTSVLFSVVENFGHQHWDICIILPLFQGNECPALCARDILPADLWLPICIFKRLSVQVVVVINGCQGLPSFESLKTEQKTGFYYNFGS